MEVGVIVNSISSDSILKRPNPPSGGPRPGEKYVRLRTNRFWFDSKGGGDLRVGFLTVCGVLQRWGKFPYLSLPGR